MAVSVFENPLPEACPLGHKLLGGRIQVGWSNCNCPPALELIGRGLPAGHHWVLCRVCEDDGHAWSHHDPPHDPG